MRKPRWITAKNGTRHFFHRFNSSCSAGVSACGVWFSLLTKDDHTKFLGVKVVDAEPKKHCQTCTKMVTKWAAQGALAALDATEAEFGG